MIYAYILLSVLQSMGAAGVGAAATAAAGMDSKILKINSLNVEK